MQDLRQKLADHGLRKTQHRIEVLSIFEKHNKTALAQSEIEEYVKGIDRVTLYRILKSFEENGLIHEAIDGSGKTKYALCSSGCKTHDHKHDHAHFFCSSCSKTHCLSEIVTPKVDIPVGYSVDSSYLVINGICSDCQ